MQAEHFHCLAALAAERDFAHAASRSGRPEAEVRQALELAQAAFGHPVVEDGDQVSRPVRLTAQGERILGWAARMDAECASLRDDLAERRRAAVAALATRRSISPRRLGLPGPAAEDIEQMLCAALRAPDHGGLHPWRVIEFPRGRREPLAELFAQEKLRRDPLASADDLARARQHATRPPALLAFVVSIVARSRTPQREQWLSAGAALGNLLNAAHQLGFGAIVLSGERCHDAALAAQLGLARHEVLAGFVSIGRILSEPAPARAVAPSAVYALWAAPAERVDAPGVAAGPRGAAGRG